MKILITENQLDDSLNVKISVNGGQSYTDYSVSSLKNGGLTLDCNPSDLKVICNTNILNYIKVFADGEKLNTGSGGGSSQTTIQELSVTENGTYDAGNNAAYNPVIVNVPSGGGEDKLLCYYADNQDPRGRIVYTDKPATQIHIDTTGDYEYSVLPVDEGKHLFIMSLATGGYELESMNLIYEDGSRSENLKDKFLNTR